VVINPEKKIPHGEIFGPPISPSTTGEISPEGRTSLLLFGMVFHGERTTEISFYYFG